MYNSVREQSVYFSACDSLVLKECSCFLSCMQKYVALVGINLIKFALTSRPGHGPCVATDDMHKRTRDLFS